MELYGMTRHETLQKRHDGERGLKTARIVKNIVSAAATVVWYAVWITSAVDYFGRVYATFNPKNVLVYVAAVAIAVLPFGLFKPQRIAEKPYEGKITAVRPVAEFKRTSRVSGYNVETRLDVEITDADGKRRTKRVRLRPGVKDYYAVGERVSVLPDVPYPVRQNEPAFGTENDRLVFCPHCGSFEPVRYTKCFECAAPLWNKRTAAEFGQ